MGMKCLPSRRDVRWVVLALAAGAIAGPAMAQQRRIPRQIDNARRVTLNGNTQPRAQAQYDRGRVAPSLTLPYVTITLAQTDSQKAELDQLLAEQQTVGSPNYHRWLTPEDYAQRFGVSQDDLNTIQTWLEGQGFQIANVARGRNWIAFSGTAAQAEAAFQTEIHQYMVNGEMHFANAQNPTVPAAFNGVVSAIHGLHDFRMKPSKRATLRPEYTGGRGSHNLAPNDLATIYDISPLYTAGIDGTGQKLVVAGQTQVNLSDIEQFRSRFGLPANDPQVMLVPNSRNPGISNDDLAEADLDLEWSGAVARNASIIFVYSFNVMDAVQYAIDQNLAPVVSVSYGSCELETPGSEAAAFQSWAKQGNAQGITWLAASGDAGAADCDDTQNPGVAVDLPGSVPQVTSMGGTEFAEGGGTYWSAINDASGASVLSYIPETALNDSAIDGEPSSTGGGTSVLFTKPSWQTGPGVPGDNARHVPDISLAASADHDGYLVYTGGSLQIFGGTSVPAPSFAGITALLNHYLVSTGAQASPGVGNINPNLYSLAQTNPSIFHDVTTGNNIVTVACSTRRACSATAVGYNAGAGYDQATGLGSVDAYKLVTGWNGGGTSGTIGSTTNLTLLTNLHNITPTEVMYLIATVTATGGLTPTGSVTFMANGSPIGSATLVGSAGTATATLAVTGSQLPLGTGTITAQYSGTSNNPSASVTVSVSSSGTGATQTPAIAALANAASYQQAFSPGGIAALFGSNFSTLTQGASSVPLPISMVGVAVLINGVAAPLYYVSSGLVNIQIPYETAAGSNATVTINNNGAVTTQSIPIAAAAPGIFMDQNSFVVPVNSATRGQLVSLYVTGTGPVSPAVSTGAAPASSTAVTALPQPTSPVAVTVGGVPAAIQFQGVPWGLVGVTQINIYVPNTVGLGTKPVVVTVGGAASSPVNLNITG
jgi:uncharacterized protein (TIGR03437 family)